MKNEKTITLVNGIEDVAEVELLCAFEIPEYDGKYIIYTKNERDEQGHIVIYSGKLEIDGNKQYLINIDEGPEWNSIKKVMKEMATYADGNTL